MTFNIHGGQHAGVINNVNRDQHISGGQHGTLVSTDSARAALQSLQEALAAVPLPPHVAAEVGAHLEQAATELRKDTPDKPTVAERLGRLTGLLASLGSLASAGARIVEPLQTLATWLGVLGQPILHLLPLLL
jgi:hypothetical protein